MEIQQLLVNFDIVKNSNKYYFYCHTHTMLILEPKIREEGWSGPYVKISYNFNSSFCIELGMFDEFNDYGRFNTNNIYMPWIKDFMYPNRFYLMHPRYIKEQKRRTIICCLSFANVKY